MDKIPLIDDLPTKNAIMLMLDNVKPEYNPRSRLIARGTILVADCDSLSLFHTTLW